MITKRQLNKRLNERRQELFNLEKAYCNWTLGDKEYNEKRPILLGQIKELEELCRTNKK